MKHLPTFIMLCLVTSQAAWSAEPVTPARPVSIILQLDRPKTEPDAAKLKAADLANSTFVKEAAGLGFTIEAGGVTRPWVSRLVLDGGSTMPEQRFWSHSPIALAGDYHDTKVEDITQVEAVLDGAQLRARMQGVLQDGHRGAGPKVTFDLSVQAVVKGPLLEGTWKGTFNGLAREGNCVGAQRPAAFGALDPANAIYQWSASGAVGVVFEVRDGKGVAGMAYKTSSTSKSGGADLTTALPADVSGVRVTVGPPRAMGRWGNLSGKVVVSGAGEFSCDGLAILPTGIGGKWAAGPDQAPVGNGSSRSLRAYAVDDPVAGQWRRWMEATFAGTAPVADDVLRQACADADQLLAMPGPSQATQFLHRYPGLQLSFIYAPWFDLKAVEGARTYRFTVGKATFDAASPTAYLSPIWKDLPPGRQKLEVAALDAGGKPVGEVQTRQFTKRVAFPAEVVKPVTDETLALELALRYPRALNERYFGLSCLLWAHRPSPPHERPAAVQLRMSHNPFPPLVRYAPAATERDAARPLCDAYLDMLIARMEEPFAVSDSYYSFGVLQENLTDLLQGHAATGHARALETARAIGAAHARLIQASGSWTWIGREGLREGIWSPFKCGTGMFGRKLLDHDASGYVNFYGKLRRQDGKDDLIDTELKAMHWLQHNSLKTAWWCRYQQQHDTADDGQDPVMAIEALEYLTTAAPGWSTSLAQAEALARWIEDQFIDWQPVTTVKIGVLTTTGRLRMATAFLRLYALTGKPLYRVKAETLFQSDLILRDPVLALPEMFLNRYQYERNNPGEALEYLALRRDLAARKEPPAPALDGPVILTLHNAIDGAEPVMVHLDLAGQQVRSAVALAPMWDGSPPLAFPVPGRVHWNEGKALHHAVEAGKLKVADEGLSGELTLHLKPPYPDKQPVAQNVTITAQRNGRMLAGRYSGGNLDGEVRPRKTQPRFLWFEVAEAVQGGEPWQNWAAAACDLKDGQAGALTLRRLHNGNAGWSAEIVSSSLELTGQGIKGASTAKVTWFGFRDGLKTDLAYHRDAWKKGLSFDAYWNTSPSHFGKATYGSDGPRKGEWKLNTRIKPPPLDGHGEYAVVHRPVLAGMYEYRLEGQRVGDLVAGTVVIKGPDGKERQCQFLGGVE